MTDILVLAFFGLARLYGLGGKAALQNLHPRFFIRADDEAAFLVEVQRLAIELADRLRLGLKVRSVAVEPVRAPMRLEVGLLQNAPDAGATQALQPLLPEGGDQVVQTPPGSGAMIRGRFPGRHRQNLDALRGGKCAAGDPSAGHPAGPGSHALDSADATGQPYGATSHLGGHVQIGGAVWRGNPEDEPTAKGQRLGSGMGAYKRCQTGVFLRSQGHRTRDRYGHSQGPYRTEDPGQHDVSVPTILHI